MINKTSTIVKPCTSTEEEVELKTELEIKTQIQTILHLQNSGMKGEFST
jgi:hypothetical protein